MVDSPSWMSWAREAPLAPARVAPRRPAAQRMTAAGMLAFAAAVVMVIIYTQCWMLALQGDRGEVHDSALVRAMFFPAYGCSVLLLALSPGEVVRTFLRQRRATARPGDGEPRWNLPRAWAPQADPCPPFNCPA